MNNLREVTPGQAELLDAVEQLTEYQRIEIKVDRDGKTVFTITTNIRQVI